MSETSSATTTSSGNNNKNKAPKLKIVVRNLPHTMKEEVFLSLAPVTKVFKETKVDWYYFSKGNEGNFPASAYFHFVRQEDLFDFSEQLTAFLNQEKSLQLTPPIQIEYAPYQKISSTLSASQHSLLRNTKQVADPRQGTIETDEDYLAFLKDLTKPIEKSMSADRRLELQEEKEREQGKEVKTTPLLEALKEKKLKKEKRKEKFSNKHKGASASSTPATAEKEPATSNSGSQHQGGGGHHGKQRVRYVEVSNEETKTTTTNATPAAANSTSTQQPQEGSNYDGGYKKNYYGGRGGRGGRGGNRGGGGGRGSGGGGRGGYKNNNNNRY